MEIKFNVKLGITNLINHRKKIPQTNLINHRGKFPFTTKSGSVWYLAFVMLPLKFVDRTSGTVARQLFKY